MKCGKKGPSSESWKHSIVVPVLKTGKPSDEASSYRPISLTSNLCKIMERMVSDGLRWWIGTKNVLNTAQCRFRSRRSTRDEGKCMMTDTNQLCVNGNMLRCIYFFLTHRTFQVRTNSNLSDSLQL